jgi:DNA helicase-2/ATP-dependent DNA helicase PcrA
MPTIAQEILEHFPELNDEQKQVVGHIDGPLLVVAGPGSGKTLCIVLRTLNLLLLGKAKPKQIILCTFTEKAAYEMSDRLSAAARKVGYNGDLSQVHISTIHSLCNGLLLQYRHQTRLGHDYETLDELTQLLFIYEHFNDIIGEPQGGKYLTRWEQRWAAIQGARDYFDKITEELVDPKKLQASKDPFLAALGRAYCTYQDRLFKQNRVDFAHLQRLVYDLLQQPEINRKITEDIRYVLVDEYQDTNYIQEQLLLKLTEKTRNLCVVGDEDQSLYRFRGATVRNILEFPKRVPGCNMVMLTTNYRSHPQIIERYDRWMRSQEWSNLFDEFRYPKTIKPAPNGAPPDYPAVFAIWGCNAQDEAERVADMIAYLKQQGVIEDYSQVAILLHSVRQEHSGHYLKALEKKGIPAYCPRARAFFDNPEIRDLVACLALVFGWHGEGRGEVGGVVEKLANYVDEGIKHLAKRFGWHHLLAQTLREWRDELENGRDPGMRPADYLYHLLAVEPFKTYIEDENKARNLAIFSKLLNLFQTYYGYQTVNARNREWVRRHLFHSFLRLLYEGGINEYEDPDQPIPKGYVQVMTIHQAKGLEFPVVVVGSLSAQLASPKQIDRDLAPFYHREPFEPEDRITLFDRMRLHYVAFSRAQKVLVLTTHKQPKDYFAPIWDGLPQWPYVQKELLAAQRFELRERTPTKKSYSFTNDLKIYDVCPRQYQFFRYYDFTPSQSAVIFFGLLVHQTIEEIHRIALDGKLHTLDRWRIRELLDRNYRILTLSGVRPIDEKAKESAFKQVMNYFNQNKQEISRIVEIEVDVSLEKEDYILVGKVDLMRTVDGRLELLDFKTMPRPPQNDPLLAEYEQQLYIYAHILEQRYGKRVDRLMLYWTAEPLKQDALMVLPYDPTRVERAARYCDEIVRRIQAKDFKVRKLPEPKICSDCDLRRLCQAQGIVKGIISV